MTIQNILHNIFNIVLQNDTRIKDNFLKVQYSNPMKTGHPKTECIKNWCFSGFVMPLPFEKKTKMSSFGRLFFKEKMC